MRVRWLRRARRQVDEIGAYIARDNPAAADRVVERIRQAADRLAAHPLMGRQGRVIDTRELVVPGTPYIVAYRVRGQSVQILAVQHSAQRWPESL
jgi:addiction module RelE/StbE family toxin